MLKKTSVLFTGILLFVLSADAQSSPSKVWRNGKEYFVFPEKVTYQYDYEGVFNLQNWSIVKKIPLITDDLPDGSYLIYTDRLVPLKNEKKDLDTAFCLYAEFSIMNNKKSGWMKFYQYNYKKKTEQSGDSIHFVNDLLDGTFTLSARLEESSMIPGINQDFSASIGYIDLCRTRFWRNVFYKHVISLTYSKGYLNGPQAIYRIIGKDSQLCMKTSFRSGLAHGDFETRTFNPFKKSKKPETTVKGRLQDGKAVDTIVFKTSYGEIRRILPNENIEFYELGSLKYEIHYPGSKSFGRAYSVAAKPRNRFQIEIANLDEWMGYSYWSYMDYNRYHFGNVLIYRTFENNRDTIIATDSFVNDAYLKYVCGLGNFRDTVINGIKALVVPMGKKDVKILMEKKIDRSIVPTPVHQYLSEYKGVMDIEYKRGKVKEVYTYKSYYDITSEKSHRVIYRPLEARRQFESHQLEIPGTDFRFIDIQFKKGRNKGLKVTHRFTADSSGIVREMHLKRRKHQLLLRDTVLLKKGNVVTEYVRKKLSDNFKYPKRKGADDFLYSYFLFSPGSNKQVILDGQDYSGSIRYKNGNRRKIFRRYKTWTKDGETFSKIVLKGNAAWIWYPDLSELIPYGRYSCLSGRINKFYQWDDFNRDGVITMIERGYTQSMLFWNAKEQGDWALKIKNEYFGLHFKNGELCGRQFIYNHKTMRSLLESQVRNDTLNGPTIIKLNGGAGAMELNFKDGLMHGEYRHFLVRDQDTAPDKLYAFYHFEKGLLKDTAFFFNKAGKMSYKIFNFTYQSGYKPDLLKFSDYFTDNKSIHWARKNQYSDSYNEEPNSNVFAYIDWMPLHYDMLSFYPDGRLFSSQQGLGFAIAFAPSQYYYPKGRLYKELILAEKSIDSVNTQNMFVYPTVTCYYKNGQLMYKGNCMESKYLYECSSNQMLQVGEVAYREFYDETGHSLLDSNGNGKITEYLPDGNKLLEGQLFKFKRDGIWVTYDRFGNPNSIGTYSNGLKTGRWLEGDLRGFNLPDNVCFMNPEELQSYLDTYGKSISLTEIYYNAGKEIERRQYNSVKD